MATGQPAPEARGDGELQLNSAHKHIHTHTKYIYIHTLMHTTNSSFNPKGAIYNRSITSKGCVSAPGDFIGPFTIGNECIDPLRRTMCFYYMKSMYHRNFVCYLEAPGQRDCFPFSFPLKEHRNIQSARRIVPR